MSELFSIQLQNRQRLVQAAGAGILMPLVMTVLMWTFPIDRRGTAMGVFGIVIAFAPAAGPTVAGIIIDQANWHVMFWIIAVLCAAVIVFAAFALERGGETNKDVKLDVASVILSTLGFGGLLYGLSAIGSYGVTAADKDQQHRGSFPDRERQIWAEVR